LKDINKSFLTWWISRICEEYDSGRPNSNQEAKLKHYSEDLRWW